MGENKDILFEKIDRCGLITLNRTNARNALTYDMIAALTPHYVAWDKDLDIYCVVMRSSDPRGFSAGGDLRAIYECWKQGKIETILELYGSEYQHNWALEKFTKPNIALIDGVVMGGGVGICVYGTHRVAGENTRFAMPEVGIGFFPDVGASHFLPRMPGESGMYLALTGRAVGQADAFYLGFATHCIASDEFDAITKALSDAQTVDELLNPMHRDPGAGEVQKMRPLIDRLFGGDCVEEILDSLKCETGEFAEWCRACAADIEKKCPVSLKVAFRQLREGVHMDLEQALRMDYRIARRFMTGDQFFEGIRAAIIDKDQRPNWSPESLDQVSGEMVDAFFAPLEEGDLALPNPYGTRIGPG